MTNDAVPTESVVQAVQAVLTDRLGERVWQGGRVLLPTTIGDHVTWMAADGAICSSTTRAVLFEPPWVDAWTPLSLEGLGAVAVAEALVGVLDVALGRIPGGTQAVGVNGLRDSGPRGVELLFTLARIG